MFIYLKYSEVSATNIAQIFIRRRRVEYLAHGKQEYVITCEWMVAVSGNWPVQSKWNYPNLNFILFDMEYEFGDAEIGGICRETIF